MLSFVYYPAICCGRAAAEATAVGFYISVFPRPQTDRTGHSRVPISSSPHFRQEKLRAKEKQRKNKRKALCPPAGLPMRWGAAGCGWSHRRRRDQSLGDWKSRCIALWLSVGGGDRSPFVLPPPERAGRPVACRYRLLMICPSAHGPLCCWGLASIGS